MRKLRKYVATIIDLSLIAVAFGGLLFACSNQESGRQSLVQKSAMIQRALYQSPLDEFLTLDAALWRQVTRTPGYYRDRDGGLLLDVRYWQETTDSVVDKLLEAGYPLDYINEANRRIFVWVRSTEELIGLSKIHGISAISISRSAPKMDLTLKVFDELQQ